MGNCEREMMNDELRLQRLHSSFIISQSSFIEL